MAKSENFFGLRKGSTKSLTFQVLRGKQITKDRVSYVANPQSAAQMEQRLKLPLVASARSVLSSLVNHSFEGVEYGEESLKYFAASNLEKGKLDVAEYVPKGVSDTGLADFLISKGSLDPMQLTTSGDMVEGYGLAISATGKTPMYITGDDSITKVGTNEASAVPMTAAHVTLVCNLLGIEANDQITILICYKGGNYTFTSNGNNVPAHYHRYVISRVLRDADKMKTFKIYATGNEITITDGYIELTVMAEGLTENTDYPTSPVKLTATIASAEGIEGDPIEGAVFIHSQKNSGTETWRRSTQRLVLNPESDAVTYEQVLPTYLKSEASSAKYLNTGIEGVNITGGTAE